MRAVQPGSKVVEVDEEALHIRIRTANIRDLFRALHPLMPKLREMIVNITRVYIQLAISVTIEDLSEKVRKLLMSDLITGLSLPACNCSSLLCTAREIFLENSVRLR